MAGWGPLAAWRQARRTCDPGCFGYHATWKITRRLGLKASPTWHADFYAQQLTHLGRGAHRHRVLIAGAADRGVLEALGPVLQRHYLYFDVVDRCATPLAAIESWAARPPRLDGKTHHLAIEDLYFGQGVLFEAVICDGLLSLLPDEAARHRVLAQLADVLRPDSKFIYTTRLSNAGRPLETTWSVGCCRASCR